MTDTDYITTTGERWTWSETDHLCDEDGLEVWRLELIAELRALRAQRDELLAICLGEIDYMREGSQRKVQEIAATKAKGEA